MLFIRLNIMMNHKTFIYQHYYYSIWKNVDELIDRDNELAILIKLSQKELDLDY